MNLLSEKQTYTKNDIDSIVRKTIGCMIDGFMDWLENGTVITDEVTKEVIPNAVIDTNPSSKELSEYFLPKLANEGIEITFNSQPPA